MDERKFVRRMEHKAVAAALRAMLEEEVSLEEAGIGAEDVLGLLANGSRSRDDDFKSDLRKIGRDLLWGQGDPTGIWLEGWRMWMEAEGLHRGEEEAHFAAKDLRVEIEFYEEGLLAKLPSGRLGAWVEADAIGGGSELLDDVSPSIAKEFAGERGRRLAGQWLATTKKSPSEWLRALDRAGALDAALRAGMEGEAEGKAQFLSELIIMSLGEDAGMEGALEALGKAALERGAPLNAMAFLEMCMRGREEMAAALAPLGARMAAGTIWGPGILSARHVRKSGWIPDALDGIRLEVSELAEIWKEVESWESDAAKMGVRAGKAAGRDPRPEVLKALLGMLRADREAEGSARRERDRWTEAAGLAIRSWEEAEREGRSLKRGAGPRSL